MCRENGECDNNICSEVRVVGSPGSFRCVLHKCTLGLGMRS